LINQIKEDQLTVSDFEVEGIIKKLFPDENFFTFKYSSSPSEKKKMIFELSEMSRINAQAINHGNLIFKNKD
jgi:hypothetical protein